FQVQLQENPNKEPVEDATVPWRAEFQTVATIRIPAQEFDTEGRMAFCENLSFTPWHAIEAHRPLGGINRTRKTVYAVLSKLRHELNDVPMREPSPSDAGVAEPKTDGPCQAAEVIEAELER